MIDQGQKTCYPARAAGVGWGDLGKKNPEHGVCIHRLRTYAAGYILEHSTYHSHPPAHKAEASSTTLQATVV
eukprot:1157302-Pelagomonas_calceolata.AAC.32